MQILHQLNKGEVLQAEFPPNTIHLNYLEPLKKWKVLDLKNLMYESDYLSSYKSFSKIILNLEKREVLDSLYDPYTAKKYIFLTKKGAEYLGEKDPSKFPVNTFVHDSKVVDIVREFLRLDFCNDFEIPKDQQQYLVPDATLIRLVPKQPMIKIAFELELTQKSRSRFLEKMANYAQTSYFDCVLYFFQNKNILLNYKREFIKTLGEEKFDQFIFVLNDGLYTKNFDFKKTIIQTKDGWRPVVDKIKTVSEARKKSESLREGMMMPRRWWSSALQRLR